MAETTTLPAGTEAPAGTRKPRVKKPGHVISFRLTDDEFATLNKAAVADMRDAHNYAYVLVKKGVAALASGAK